MVNVKLIVCGFDRKYTINHVRWKELPTVSKRMVDMLEGHLGEFTRDTDYDESYTIAYVSSLPEGTKENAVEYALDQVVPCLMNPDIGIELAKQEDSSYAGCQWWHIKQNSHIAAQEFFSGLEGKEAWNLPALRSERCPDCNCSWGDPRPDVLQRLEFDLNVFSYEKTWYRYIDIIEGRMDYVDGELITLSSNENNNADGNGGGDSEGRSGGNSDNVEQTVKAILAEILDLDQTEVFLTTRCPREGSRR